MQELTPQRIGRYDIICPLGEGGMARAYLAVNRGPGGFNKLAVIKLILPELASDANFVAMLLDEARLAARLHHPNIVQTFDVVEHEGGYALAMEYLDGCSLSTIYRRIHPTRFPVEAHLWILTQVLTGLHYAHTLRDYDGTPLGVVHRDVNPSNVLVTYSGDVKLLDFGVAKARGALATNTEKCIKGKPGYCAPEQLRSDDIDARADVFAVGVMLWEALAGKRLNRSKTLLEAAKTRLSGQEPKIRDVKPDTPSELADICDKAMAMDPSQRYANAAEFGEAISAQLGSKGTLGRQFLVSQLEREFSADRQTLRQQIELQLKPSDSGRPIPTVTETMVRESPSPPPTHGSSTPLPSPPKQPRFSKPHAVVAGVMVVAAAAALGGFFAFRTADPGVAAKQPIPESPLTRPSPTPPSEHPIPPKAESIPREAVPPAEPPAAAIAPGPSHSNSEQKPSRATAVAARKRGALRGSTGSDAPSAQTAPDGTKRRNIPAEGPAATVEPGSHLVRPSAKPIQTTVDEKDPYSP